MDYQNEIIIKTLYRHQNEPVQNLKLFECAWDEFPELQTTDKITWTGNSLLMMQGLDRYEVGVFTPTGDVVGAAIIAPDIWDAHVGPCISVFAQYILPEFRNRGISLKLMREAIRITKESNYTVLAFTHRVGDYRYETVYKEIK